MTNQICNVRQIVYWKHSENIKIIKKETEQHMSWILVKFLFTIIITGNNNDWKQGIDNNKNKINQTASKDFPSFC